MATGAARSVVVPSPVSLPQQNSLPARSPHDVVAPTDTAVNEPVIDAPVLSTARRTGVSSGAQLPDVTPVLQPVLPPQQEASPASSTAHSVASCMATLSQSRWMTQLNDAGTALAFCAASCAVTTKVC